MKPQCKRLHTKTCLLLAHSILKLQLIPLYNQYQSFKIDHVVAIKVKITNNQTFQCQYLTNCFVHTSPAYRFVHVKYAKNSDFLTFFIS